MKNSILSRKVGFRYMMAKKSSSFLSLITAISIGGVTIGILTMVVTLSVMSGFEHELKTRLFAAETHIQIEHPQKMYFPVEDEWIRRIEVASPEIESVYPVLQAEAILRSGKKVTGAVIKGIEQDQMLWLKKHIVEDVEHADLPPGESLEVKGASKIYMGTEMAFDLGVVPGDWVTAVSPVESEGPFGAVPRMKRFLVEGIYKTGVPEQELHTVFTALPEVESFLKQTKIMSHVEVRVKHLEDAEPVAQAIRKKLGAAYLVRSWQELNAHLFHSLMLERTAMFCILIFIVIVASFNIVSNLMMMVMEKKRSLSILRAMGATPKQISGIFVWSGAAIGWFGILFGGGLGLAICYLLKRYPIIELPEYYYDRTLPVVVSPQSIFLIFVAALVIVLFASILPARRASELPPIEAIREG